MICISPVTIRNPKYGQIDQIDQYMQVPCRKCSPCVLKRARQWMFRLQWEERRSLSSFFMTYTYDENNVPLTSNGLLTLHPTHHTEFMKRLRIRLKRDGYDVPLKYYMAGEYGSDTERPHYHSILFNLPQFYADNIYRLEDEWQKGAVDVRKCTKETIAYVCGYVNKLKHFTSPGQRYKNTDLVDDRIPELTKMSKHLGANFLSDQRIKKMKQDLEPTIKIEGGKQMAIPEYYKRKALTDAERKIIADKTLAYVDNNPTFTSEQHHVDYIKMDALKRQINAKKRNKI